MPVHSHHPEAPADAHPLAWLEDPWATHVLARIPDDLAPRARTHTAFVRRCGLACASDLLQALLAFVLVNHSTLSDIRTPPPCSRICSASANDTSSLSHTACLARCSLQCVSHTCSCRSTGGKSSLRQASQEYDPRSNTSVPTRLATVFRLRPLVCIACPHCGQRGPGAGACALGVNHCRCHLLTLREGRLCLVTQGEQLINHSFCLTHQRSVHPGLSW